MRHESEGSQGNEWADHLRVEEKMNCHADLKYNTGHGQLLVLSTAMTFGG